MEVDTLGVVGRWRIEESAEGIPLVFGDGKYPHDPPRVASALEAALHEQLRGAVDRASALEQALLIACENDEGRAARFVRMAQAVLADLGGR